MMTKKILFICQRPPFPPNKGEKIRTYYQIRHLVEKGFDVCVASPVENEQAESDLNALRHKLGVTIIHGTPDTKIVAITKALCNFRSISEMTFYSQSLNRKIEEHIKADSIDTIMYTASSLIRYAESKSVLKYMDFMDLDSDKWKQYSDTSSFPMSWVYRRESKYIAALEAKSLALCKKCYLISDNEKDLLKNTAKVNMDNVLTIGNGIAFDEFYPPKTRRSNIKSNPIFLFVGVMDYKPNEEAVVWFCNNVFPELRNKYRNAKFRIVGMNPSAKIQELSSQKGVEVTGRVDSVLPYFHQSDLFVAPFHLARGVQNKILQSFACALPVVTTPMGVEGIEGQVDLCSRLCETPIEFFNTICTLISDDPMRFEMGNKATSLITTQYSWSTKLEDFLISDRGV